MAAVVIEGTGGADHLTFTATGAHGGYYVLNGGPAVQIDNVDALEFDGGEGDDLFTLINPDGGLFAAAITYRAGGQGGDALEVLGGAADSGEDDAGETRDSGVLRYTLGGLSQTIDYSGIAPIVDTTSEGSHLFSATAGNDAITLSNSSTAGRAIISGATFESYDFANKTSLTINGNGGTDSLIFNNPTAPTGLTTLQVSGVTGGISQTAPIAYTNLVITASGGVTLGGANTVANLAANLSVAGAGISFQNSGALTVASGGGGTYGLTTNNGAISVATVNGALTVSATPQSPAVGSGTGAISLTAGSTGSADNAITLAAGGMVLGSGGITLTADNIVLIAGISGYSGLVTLKPYQAGTLINLGGADGANTLGLTDAELHNVSAGVLRIGSAQAGNISVTAAISPTAAPQLELVTGGQVINSAASNTLSATRLGVTATQGISSTPISGAYVSLSVAASYLEASVTSGGMYLATAGAVTIGGVSGALSGLRVAGSGAINLYASGTVTLADTDAGAGGATIMGAPGGGDVSLSVNGTTSDFIDSVNYAAILAPSGGVNVYSSRDILLGTTALNSADDVRASGSISLHGERDTIIGGATSVVSDAYGTHSSSGVSLYANRSLSITGAHGTGATVGSNGTGNVSLIAGGGGTLTINAPAGLSTVYSAGGNVTLSADRIVIGASSGVTASAAGRSVSIASADSGWATNLGSTTDTATSTTELSDSELDRIVTPTLRIGNTSSGAITLSSQITASTYSTLALTGASVVDGTAGEQADLTVNSLAIRTVSGIGSADSLDTAVAALAFYNSGSGAVNITNTGNLVLGAVDTLGISANFGGDVALTANSGSIQLGGTLVVAGATSFKTTDAIGAQDVTLIAGAQLIGNGAVTLISADGITLAAGSTLQASGGLNAYLDYNGNDAGVGGVMTIAGAIDTGSNLIYVAGSSDPSTLIIAASASVHNRIQYSGQTLGDTLQLYGTSASEIYSISFTGTNSEQVTRDSDHLSVSTSQIRNFSIFAGDGDDKLTISETLNTISVLFDGGNGNDTLNGANSTVPITATGDAGNDVLRGGYAADTLSGGAGDDTLTGGLGNDTLDGGSGIDTAIFSGLASQYTLTRSGGQVVGITGPDGTDTLTGIERLQFDDVTLGGGVPFPRDDFGGDLMADIVWRNSGGDVRLWTQSGATVANDQAVASVSTDWRIAAVADLSGDGRADLVWRDSAGDTRLWSMNGAGITGDQAIASVASNWKIEATGDFDGDGHADLLWRDTAGDLREWKMAGATIVNDAALASVASSWFIAGTGDFNLDGKDDIVWRNGADGSVRLWTMNGTTITNDQPLATVPNSWTVLGIGDFGGDGKADLLWESSGGDVRIWDMNGAQIINDRSLVSGVGASWHVQEIADFNGDGRADILWRNADSGEVRLWTLSATTIASDQHVADVATNWTVAGQPHDMFI